MTVDLFNVLLFRGSLALLIYKIQLSQNSSVGSIFLHNPFWSKLYRLGPIGHLNIDNTLSQVDVK